MAICSSCSTAIQKLRSQDSGLVHQKDRKVYAMLPKYHRSAIPECWICNKFSRWVEAEHPKLMEVWVRRSLMVEFVPFGSIISNRRDGVLLPLFIDITPSGYEIDNCDGCPVELNFIAAGDMATSSIATTNYLESSSSDLSLVESWIRECTTTHKECKENHHLWYPTRLLYVGSQDQGVKLIITKEHTPKGIYMTLSHRWGDQPYTKLESSTILELQNAVDASRLPQTFQDTIKIARHLGIQYLWIDSLCIKQGKEGLSDWELESQMMDKVYSNAFLNVSATMSIDGSESLFKERHWDSILPSAIDLEINGLSAKCHVFDGDIWPDEIENAPLNQRGWVFQERFLASRVLHFGRRQIGWECNKLEALEIFPNGLPETFGLSVTRKYDVLKALAQPRQYSDSAPDISFVEEWQMLVSQYSKCKLTRPADKLVAFAGVAKSMIRESNDRYVAGMWERNLVYDLAWWRSTEDREASPINETRLRAPSWSWASVDGEIVFPTMLGGPKSRFVEIMDFSDFIPSESRPHTCGTIRAKGPCLPLSIEWAGDMARFMVAQLWFSEDDELNSDVDLECSNQEARELAQRGELLLMPLFATPYKLHAIILVKIGDVDAHLRLGAVQIEIVKESGQSRSTLENTSNEKKKRHSSMDWVEKAVEKQVELKRYLNKNAVALVHYIQNSPQSSRIVYII